MPYSDFRSVQSERPQPMVFAGGVFLTLLAGAVNVAMLSFYAVPVSHMSGAVSRLGMGFGTRRFADLGVVGLLIGGFTLGCVLTGALVGSSALASRRRYALVLLCEATVLGLAAALLGGATHVSVILCAMACGMQNAMASSYYGLVVRTTHVTGIITDLGFMLGARLTAGHFVWWKFLLLLLLVSGYLAGGTLSAAAMAIRPGLVLWGCSALALAIAGGCLRFHQTASEPSERDARSV